MKTRLFFSVSVIFILAILFGIRCEKKTILKSNFERNTFLISQLYPQINGKWKLYQVSGGFAGTGHELNFDYLEIEDTDRYRFIKNDNILEYGTILIEKEDAALISFQPDQNSDIFWGDREKYVIFHSDSLDLQSPCCDRFNYHFVKELL